MNRVIITPAQPPAAALAEVKQWLGITIAADDAPLGRLLATALEAAEGFTGTMLLEQTCEEVVPALGCWQTLATRPVQAIVAAEAIDAAGQRSVLDPDAYQVELLAGGSGQFRLMIPAGTRVAIRFRAGLAVTWDGLPEALRHGVVRLAAHQHREREDAGAAPIPPASVAALWRPGRRLRLA